MGPYILFNIFYFSSFRPVLSLYFRAFSLTSFLWTFQATSCELKREITGALSVQAILYILNVTQRCPFCAFRFPPF